MLKAIAIKGQDPFGVQIKPNCGNDAGSLDQPCDQQQADGVLDKACPRLTQSIVH